MARRVATRTLAEVVRAEAPVSARRAASIMVAVARAVERAETGGREVAPPTAATVVIAADGTVRLDDPEIAGPRAGTGPTVTGSETGAAIGRLLFELLVGRPPLGRDDAFEPTLLAELGTTVSSLLARSFSDSPGQWPDVATWRAALEAYAGGSAPPLPPAVVRKERLRRVGVALGVVVLALVTVVTLVLAPRWWDATEEGAPAAGPPTEGSRAGVVVQRLDPTPELDVRRGHRGAGHAT